MGEETHKETSRAYQWRELDDGCKQEPSDTLSDRNHVSGSREPWLIRHSTALPVSKEGVREQMCLHRDGACEASQ